MVFDTDKEPKEYQKIKKSYADYLAAYKQLNNGSLNGATDFATFYISKTYTSRYSDSWKFLMNNGK